MQNKVTLKKERLFAMRTILCCCVLVLFTASNCFGQQVKKSEAKPSLIPMNLQNEKARDLILAYKINEAVASYAESVEKDSTNVTMIAEYAYALALDGFYDGALINLDRIGSGTGSSDVIYFKAQVFALMGYYDISTELWKPSDNSKIPAWLAINSDQLLEKYKRKPNSIKLSKEEIIAKFKRANELGAYHSYFQSIALFHEIIDYLPNEYLPYAGYSVVLEKIGALQKSTQMLEKAISVLGNKAENLENKQFLEKRLSELKVRITQKPNNTSNSFYSNKPESSRPQMMLYAGGVLQPNLTSINFRIGYYLLDHTNGSLNLGIMSDSVFSLNFGLSFYSSYRSFVYGGGLQISSSGNSYLIYSIGFRIKSKKNKNVTNDLFLEVDQGLSSQTPTTFNLSYGTSIYFGKRTATAK
jgi:tetratricopeptide (TPR) repeat protein